MRTDDDIAIHPDQMTLGLVRSDHPETSQEAAVLRRKKVEEDRGRILERLALDSMTDEQMQNALGMPPNTQRPRRVELVNRGLVEATSERRKTEAGKTAIVWGLTDKGRAQWNGRRS